MSLHKAYEEEDEADDQEDEAAEEAERTAAAARKAAGAPKSLDEVPLAPTPGDRTRDPCNHMWPSNTCRTYAPAPN